MTEARDFHLGDILSVTTGCVVSPRYIDGVYGILNWMTGENLYTHQIPRASEACQTPLLAQHPDLAAVAIPAPWATKPITEKEIMDWLSVQTAQYGETRPVAPLPPGQYTAIDPIEELTMIRRGDIT